MADETENERGDRILDEMRAILNTEPLPDDAEDRFDALFDQLPDFEKQFRAPHLAGTLFRLLNDHLAVSEDVEESGTDAL